MYGSDQFTPSGGISALSGGGLAAATLPFTGLSILWIVVVALTVLAVVLAVARLLPKRTS